MLSNCNIVDAYIEDDLQSFSVTSTNNSVEDWFNNSVSPLSINSQNLALPIYNEYWTPVLIDAHNRIQKIVNRGIYNKNCLGTNDYITFNPKFKNYFGSSGGAYASINWRLNSYDFPFTVTTGLLFWSRRISDTSIEREFKWEKLATHIPFYDGQSGPYIKLPEDRILNYGGKKPIENNAVLKAEEILGETYKDKIYRIYYPTQSNKSSELWIPDGDVFSYRDDINYTSQDKTFISAPIYKPYNAIYNSLTIHRIKSIYNNTYISRRYKNLAKYLASSPYITDFYIDYMKRQEIKKLVDNYVDGTTGLNLTLSYISQELNNTNSKFDFNLNSDNYNATNNTPSSKILRTPNDIFQKLKNKYGVKLAIPAGGSVNFSKTALPHGDNLAITQSYELITNDNLSLGSNKQISATQTISVGNFSVGSKTYNSSVYGDYQRIGIYSRTAAGNVVQTNDIPVYDGIAPQWNSRLGANIVLKYFQTEKDDEEDTPNHWNPTYTVFKFIPPPQPHPTIIGSFVPGQSKIYDDIPFRSILTSEDLPDKNEVPVITLSAFYPLLDTELFNGPVEFPNKFLPYDDAKKDFSCKWEYVSGPEVKFTDQNKSGIDKKLYNTSTADIVDMVCSDYGEVTIKCTIYSPQGVHTKYKTFFLITEDDLTVEKKFNEDLSVSRNIVPFAGTPNLTNQMQPIRLNPRGIKVVAPAFNKIAFNANGIVWLAGTDFKVINTGFSAYDIFSLSSEKFIFQSKNKESKFYQDPGGPLSPANRSLNLGVSITYDHPSNTTIYLDRLVLEKVRDGTDECSDCLSLFNAGLTGYDRRAAGEGVTGNTLGYQRFYDGFSLLDIVNDESVGYGISQFSTDYGSPVRTYGNYSSIANELETKKYLDFNLPPEIQEGGQYTAITGYRYDHLADWRTVLGENGGPPTDTGNINFPNIPRYKLCYMQAHDTIESSYDDRDFYLDFQKGAFIPESGWVTDPTLNTSYVLKFNPGARDSFAFSGPKIGINGSSTKYISGLSALRNEPSIFTSTVSVGIAYGIQWDPLCECPPGQGGDTAGFQRRKRFQNTQNQLHKEYVDAVQTAHTVMTSGENIPYKSFHGYRFLGGGESKPIQRTEGQNLYANDEFVIERKDYSNTNYEIKYNFAVTGPAKRPEEIDPNLKDYLTNPSSSLTDEVSQANFELRDPRVNTFQIKDLEVNLKFLNYVNTQDLVIWLETELSDLEKNRQKPSSPKGKPPQYSSPITSPEQFIDQVFPVSLQHLGPLPNGGEWSGGAIGLDAISDIISKNTELADYLKALTRNNSTIPQENFKLILLNQEYVKNNEFNMNLKFSDHAINTDSSHSHKNSVSLTDEFKDIKYANRNYGVENGGILSPSTAAMGYSENDHINYHSMIRKNNLDITCNTFSKFFGKSLFMKPPPESGPCPEGATKQQGPSYESETRFMLKIAVVDETDLMGPYDNLKNSVLYGNFLPDRNKITSTNSFNNLCSWEIIIHTDSEPKPIPTTNDSINYGRGSDILGSIDYYKKPNKDGYFGYSFISDLTGLTELLPLGNINAPFQYIYDTSSCLSSSSDPLERAEDQVFPEVKWPDYAIMDILAASATSYTFVAAGGLPAVGGINLGTASPIINYLNETRRWQGLDRKNGEIYDIDHTGYELGSSDKILLNISKDGAFWYTVEASIFRLANTPAMKSVHRQVLPIAYANSDLDKLLSIFEYQIVNNYEDLFDDYIFNEEEDKIVNDLYMSHNNICRGLDIFDKINYDQNSNYTVIRIDNSVVFDLYDQKDSMIFVDNVDGDRSIPIVGKAKILLDNIYCSIFIFNVDKEYIKKHKEIKLGQNIIAIVDPVTSSMNTLEDPEENVGSSDPVSQWKFNGDIEDESYDDQWSSVLSPIIQKYNFHSRGSYGDISNRLEKNYLHHLDKTNSLKKIYEIFNNTINNKLKYNKILLYDKNSETFSDAIITKTHGFSCSFDQILGKEHVFDQRTEDGEKFIAENPDTVSKTKLEELKKLLVSKYSNKKYKDERHQIIYLKNDDFNDIYSNNQWNNYDIVVQGDMVVSNKVNFYGNLQDIDDRLYVLNNAVDEQFVAGFKIDDPVIDFFSQYPSIQSALLYYQNMSDAATSEDILKINLIADHIQKLCAENNSLQKLRKQIAPNQVKSHITANLNNATNKINIYSVDYSINNNLYWINIDPKQSCGIAEELRPKVLKKTVTTCVFLDPNLQGQEKFIDNNMCYQSAYAFDVSDDNAKADSDIEIDFFPGFENNQIDFPQTIPVIYKIPQAKIDENKKILMDKYPSISAWKNQVIFRTFYMPTTKDITFDFSQNYIMLVEEHYEVAVPEEHNLEVGDAISGGYFNNDYSADVNNVGGIQGEPACTLGSPGGLGLLTEPGGGVTEDSAARMNGPVRVYNIFNLDNQDSIRVKFRKIPKMLRGVDMLGTLYRYGVTAKYRQDLLIQPLQPYQTTIGQGYLNNMPYLWQCYEYNDQASIKKSTTPTIFNIMNEIIYRGYMGSADHFENMDTRFSTSGFPDEMIPFEYLPDKDE